MPKGAKVKSSDVVEEKERKESIHLNCSNLKNFEDLSIGDIVSVTVSGKIKSLDENQYDREETRRSLSVEIDSYDVKKSGSVKGKRPMEGAYEKAQNDDSEDESEK